VVDVDQKKADGLGEEVTVSEALMFVADKVDGERVKSEGRGEDEPSEGDEQQHASKPALT